MALGLSAYSQSILPEQQWAALATANAELVDWVLDDLVSLAQGTPFPDLVIADYLPRVFLHRYNDDFLRDFLVCLVSVGLKLMLPGFHPLGCTGEELAAAATRDHAVELLEAEGELADFAAWDDGAFEDLDHELLFDPALDGLPQTEVARALGMANLEYDDWFVPFDPPRVVHPYLAADDADGDDDDREPWERDDT
jgi:hypothetical protein